MKTATPRRSVDEMRADLMSLKLKEEPAWIDGYAFTYRKNPAAAVDLYRETHGGAEPTRFYLAQLMFVLSD